MESLGSTPSHPDLAKELHYYAMSFRESLPPFLQQPPDKRWDDVHPYIPIQRENLTYLIESFLIGVHRPYLMIRPQSQRQIYASAVAILESQERLGELLDSQNRMPFVLGVVFPTFDAAMMLAVVMVLRPDQTSFRKTFGHLQRAVTRLKAYGPKMALAKHGAELLGTAMRRVNEANGNIGDDQMLPGPQVPIGIGHSPHAQSSHSSSTDEPWQTEVSQISMEWNKQNTGLDFDFADLEIPTPLKELVLDDSLLPLVTNNDQLAWGISQPPVSASNVYEDERTMFNTSENALWAYLTET